MCSVPHPPPTPRPPIVPSRARVVCLEMDGERTTASSSGDGYEWRGGAGRGGDVRAAARLSRLGLRSMELDADTIKPQPRPRPRPTRLSADDAPDTLWPAVLPAQPPGLQASLHHGQTYGGGGADDGVSAHSHHSPQVAGAEK